MDFVGGRIQGGRREDGHGYRPPRRLRGRRSVIPSICASASSPRRSVAVTAWGVPALASDPVDAKGERRRASSTCPFFAFLSAMVVLVATSVVQVLKVVVKKQSAEICITNSQQLKDVSR
jgi:hypothetical protein